MSQKQYYFTGLFPIIMNISWHVRMQNVVLLLHWSFVYLTVENVLLLNQNLVCFGFRWLPLPLKLQDARIEINLSQEMCDQSCHISNHLSIFTFSLLVVPHFLETSKSYNKEVCEHKLNKTGVGSTPRALPLGEESNVSVSRSVWLAPALLFLHHLFTFSSLHFSGSIF